MNLPRIEREVVLPAPPDAVWRALTEAGELGAWFGAEVELDAAPGGRARFRFPDGSERAATVEEAAEARRFTFRWAPFVRHADGSSDRVESTRVVFDLKPDPEGTRLTVTESGLTASLTRAQA